MAPPRELRNMAGSQDTRLLHVDYRDEFGRSTSSGIAIGIGPKISEEHWGSGPLGWRRG